MSCALQARALLDTRSGGYEAVPMGSGDGKQARASSEGKIGSGNIGAAGDPELLAADGTDPACCGA